MILATHALVGAAIGKNIGNPWIIIPLSLATHYLLDILPHGEYLDNKSTFKNTTWKVVLDLLVGFSLILFYIYIRKIDPAKTADILLGAFFSLFPDLLTLLYWKIGFVFLKKIYFFHEWIHELISQKDLPWSFRNARNDLLVSFLALLFLFI